MTYTDKHIVATYSSLFEGLNSVSRIELIEKLSRSLKNEKKSKEKNFTNLLEHLLQNDLLKILLLISDLPGNFERKK